MKKTILFILFSSFTILGIQAQTIGNAKIKNADKIVWFGLDFSATQCVGRSGFSNPEDIANRMVHAWNDLFITEHDKFNVNEMLRKNDFYYDLASATKQNETVQADGLIVAKATSLDRSKIESILSNYSSEEYNDGLGLVFIVEKLDKLEPIANVHVTLFDIGSKEVVQVIKYTGAPRGFGFRNYWAGAFYDVIDKIEDDYKKWIKKNK